MKNLLIVLAWCCCLAVSLAEAAREPAIRYAEMLDEQGDQVLHRAVVPSREKPQGEVQLIRRGKLLVVQTLLASPVLKRVAAVIDDKEQHNWPESREGYLDSRRYREELFRATEQAWNLFRQRQELAEARQFLAIEFIVGPGLDIIALSAPTITGSYGNMRLTTKRPLQVWRSTDQYVRGNIIEIIQDSFGLDRPATEAMVQPLWPSRN
jgi:hypothetical protein